MITFAVNLIKAPPLSEMSGREVFELMVSARHVAGPYWFYEGVVEALGVEAEVVANGVSQAIGDLSDEEFVAHCASIFNFLDLAGEPLGWQMLQGGPRTTAAEARKLAGQPPADALGTVLERGKERAAEGKMSLPYPFLDLDLNRRSRSVLIGQLAELGYDYVEHEVPPSNDPREQTWGELRW